MFATAYLPPVAFERGAVVRRKGFRQEKLAFS
jgi:hypothetical protein